MQLRVNIFLEQSIITTKSDVTKESIESSTKAFNCSVCNIEVPNESQLKQHLIGQKHKKAYRILEEQQRINKKCGLYVKGEQNFKFTFSCHLYYFHMEPRIFECVK